MNPWTGEVVNTVKAKSVLELMAVMAWQTGDPGIINLSAINQGTALANPLLAKKGMIDCTNVCGEIPQYPYESCNLGYVNFTKFVRVGERKSKRAEEQKSVRVNNQPGFDYKRLKEVMRVATRLMD